MTIAYFDCFSGVAGDMVLGAFLDAGMPLAHLKKQLKLLPIGSYELKAVKKRQSICGTNLNVVVKKTSGHGEYESISRMIAKSRLSKKVKIISLAIFEMIARAEARIHGVCLKKVHFHEVGAVDSIIDIVGAAIGFDYFDFDAVYSSPLPITRGRIKCEHGSFPVPAPATLEIIKGVPVEPAFIKKELVTPTGAAILVTVVENFGECPLQKIEKVGYGFGDDVIKGSINALRLMIGEGFPSVVIQSDIDDMNPQFFEYAIEKIFSAGAVDVDLAAIQMKKNRPGVRLTALAPWDKKDAVINSILKETTTFGVRYWPVERKMLTRELVVKKTKIGNVQFKIGFDASGNIVKAMPEYEDIKKIAKKKGRSIIEIYRTALESVKI